MKFTISRDVENNKFKTTITFADFGSHDISEEDEKELLENYPQSISLKDIEFEGYYEVTNNEVVESDETDGDLVKFVMPLQREVCIDENFIVKFEVNTSQIADDEVGLKLVNKVLVCQAKSLLFEEKIIEAIKDKLDAVKGLDNDFEKQSPIEVVV